jgi:hypothetical protein
MAEIAHNGYIGGNFATNLTVSGLSKLQRWLLDHAQQNRLAERRDAKSKGADLYFGEVLHGYYGFPYEFRGDVERNPRRDLQGGSQMFNPTVIGRSRYNAANAALSRACTRLEQRGLVVVLHGACSHWAGIRLSADDQTAAAARWKKAKGKPAPKGE